MTDKKIVMVGAGLVGTLMACYLAKKGYEVEIYEKRSDMRNESLLGGKSINLALSTRGIKPLEEIGIIDDIMKMAIPMRGRMIHNTDGTLTFQPYGKDENEVINSVSRAELNIKLLDHAESLGVKISFDSPCVDFNHETGEVLIEQNNNKISIKGLTTIASDGAGSAVRYAIQKLGRFNYSQNFLEQGYKELTIPPGPNGKHQIEKNALHIWPRKSFMMIALPNPNGSFTATLFMPFLGNNGFDSIDTEDKLSEFFKVNFPDVLPLMPDYKVEYFSNPIGLLGTIKCSPWFFENKVLLIGDASHAIVPFYGQGMNAGFEDCRILNEIMSNNKDEWEMSFKIFNDIRKENTDAIAELAIDNFIEMRDKVADEHFLLIKEAELGLYERYPLKMIPQYSMVTFSHIPYSEARLKGDILLGLVEKHCQDITDISQFDYEAAYNDVMKEYEKLK